MTMAIQVLYPTGEDKHFDYEYYIQSHLPMVTEVLSPHGLENTVVTRGLAGGPDIPAPYFAIATMIFPDEDAMNAALAAAAPLLQDIPNYTNSSPEMLIGAMIP